MATEDLWWQAVLPPQTRPMIEGPDITAPDPFYRHFPPREGPDITPEPYYRTVSEGRTRRVEGPDREGPDNTSPGPIVSTQCSWVGHYRESNIFQPDSTFTYSGSSSHPGDFSPCPDAPGNQPEREGLLRQEISRSVTRGPDIVTEGPPVEGPDVNEYYTVQVRVLVPGGPPAEGEPIAVPPVLVPGGDPSEGPPVPDPNW